MPEQLPPRVRIAAVADVHLGEDNAGSFRRAWERLGEHADLLLVAGDLTQHGTAAEGRIVAHELAVVPVPVFAVLGNHDYHGDEAEQITESLMAQGTHVLDGSHGACDVRSTRVGIAGVKGFGGGFVGKSATAFGEPEMKRFVEHTEAQAQRLETALCKVDADVRLALTHYSPTPDTLVGEPPEIHPFLGAYQLAAAIDDAGADLAVHGHAHAGAERGVTSRGTPVRNVAEPVIRAPYTVYEPPFTAARR